MFGVFIYFLQLPLFSVTNSQLLHSPEVLNFFSGFFTQLHKLRSLRRSFLHFHYYILLCILGGQLNGVNIFQGNDDLQGLSSSAGDIV